MSWWAKRRARWAVRVLDAIWCGEEWPRALFLSEADLRAALVDSAAARQRYNHLVALDEGLAAPGLRADDAALLGLAADDAAVPGPGADDPAGLLLGASSVAVRDGRGTFEARVLAAVASKPSRVSRPMQIGFAAAAVAACVLLLLWLPLGSEVSGPTAPAHDEEFAARGAAEPEAPAPAVEPLRLSGVCVVAGPDGVPVAQGENPLRCPLRGSFQPLVSDPLGRGLSVAVFALQRSESGQWSSVPHVPTPASPDAARLGDSAALQPVGRPHRLEVNHTVGAGYLVMVARAGDIDWFHLEKTMDEFAQGMPAGPAPPPSLTTGWEAVVVEPFEVLGP